MEGERKKGRREEERKEKSQDSNHQGGVNRCCPHLILIPEYFSVEQFFSLSSFL